MMRYVVRILLILSLIASGLIAWGNRSLNEDLFLAFCAGRDTLAGFLARPDRWSFTTDGRIWIDQSWLSHLLYYVSFLGLQDLGPVLIQGFLLAACLIILFFRCRALGASVEVSLIAMTLGTLSLAPFMGIRAENFGMFYCILLTNILVAPDSWGRWRQLGALLVLAVWSNSHGSFMLGFVLVCVRFLLDAFSTVRDSVFSVPPRRKPDAVGWLVTVGVAAAVIAFANPYGTDNLRMPFRQLSAGSITGQWVDWLPLIHMPTLFQHGFLKPLSVIPFLLLGIMVLILVVAVPFTVGIDRVVQFAGLRAKSFTAMEIAAALVLLPLVFRFRRLMLFAAPALVPTLAMLIQIYWEWAQRRFRNSEAFVTNSHRKVSGIASFAWLLLLCFLLYKCTVVPHMQGNPLAASREERPLVSRLMSHDMIWSDVARFMRDNHIEGRIFTNVLASDYLLFNVPRIQLFFDLRAQSIYSDRVIEAYVSVMTAETGTMDQATRLLDQYGVQVVVLDTASDPGTADRYFALAVQLMTGRKWACIYRDDWVFVLVRPGSERFHSIIEKGDLDEFRYRSEATRTFSRAFLNWFMKGQMQDKLLRDVETALHQHPDPAVYRLVIAAFKGSSRCLDEKARRFALSEANKLSSSNFMVAGGAPTVLRSLWELLNVLEQNETMCGSEVQAALFRKEKTHVRNVFEQIRREYDGL